MMKVRLYKDCDIDFLDQKRFPTTQKGKYTYSPTKNVVMHI